MQRLFIITSWLLHGQSLAYLTLTHLTSSVSFDWFDLKVDSHMIMWVTLIIALRIWLILSVVATFILVATINNHYRHHCRIELITASYQLCWQQGPGAFHCRIVLIMLLHSIDTLTTYAVYTCTHCTHLRRVFLQH